MLRMNTTLKELNLWSEEEEIKGGKKKSSDQRD